MPKLVLQIILWVLKLISDRSESAPARKEKADREEINEVLAKKKPSKDELNDAGARLWNLIKRVSRPEGRSSTRQ